MGRLYTPRKYFRRDPRLSGKSQYNRGDIRQEARRDDFTGKAGLSPGELKALPLEPKTIDHGGMGMEEMRRREVEAEKKVVRG